MKQEITSLNAIIMVKKFLEKANDSKIIGIEVLLIIMKLYPNTIYKMQEKCDLNEIAKELSYLIAHNKNIKVRSFITNLHSSKPKENCEVLYIFNTYSKNKGLYKCTKKELFNKTIISKMQLESLLKKCERIEWF